MQLINGGPDVPDSLLEAHEEGRVVFFCGAGISYPSGLKDFNWLVNKLIEQLGPLPDKERDEAICKKQFDRAIGLLEERHTARRAGVRSKVKEILTPEPDKLNLDTHNALLTLAKTRENKLRLITTNFDRLFEHVINENESINTYKAPALPVPKQHWDGLIYLHGLLPGIKNDSDLNDLVISSGDFGLAYLMEGWAARFICELFRNFNVVFVGYSIEDPVLRYMVDALAADKLRGEQPLEMFSFGSFSHGKEEESRREWQAKNVTPILYQENQDHKLLHETLHKWADDYRDGIMGKERIVTDFAYLIPGYSTQSDDYVSRMLWALSDPTGIPAKRFAEFNPIPSLEWLVPFSENRFKTTDLKRFGINPMDSTDSELLFSFFWRPTPYHLAPKMAISDWSEITIKPDKVMYQMSRWLTRHLDKPELLHWLIKNQGTVSAFMKKEIKNKLREIEQKGPNDSSGNNNLDGIPDNRMLRLWNLLLAGCVKWHEEKSDIYEWLRRFDKEGLSTTLRLELLEMLKPKVKLTEPFEFDPPPDLEEYFGNRNTINNIVNWEIVLSNSNVRYGLEEYEENDKWDTALKELLPDLTRLLNDALDLMKVLDGADSDSDASHWDLPSISNHEQNSKMNEWTFLIELNRDAWLSLSRKSPKQGIKAAENWLDLPYPLFRRLAFFAATQDGVVPFQIGLEWLLSDEGWWFWSTETRREAIRLLVFLAPKLGDKEKETLFGAISSGPPRSMYISEIEDDEWIRIRDREIWFRLKKFLSGGGLLNKSSQTVLDNLSKQYHDYQIAEDERDEFPIWQDNNPDFGENYNPTPSNLDELIQWIKDFPNPDFIRPDNWPKRCREDFDIVVSALTTLANEDVLPQGRWHQALSCWADDNNLKTKSWKMIAPILGKAPKEKLQGINGLAGWLQEQSESFEGQVDTFLKLCDLLLEIEDEENVGESDDLIFHAINHRVGIVTEGLLKYWYRESTSREEKFEKKLRYRFSRICNTQNITLRHGRVLLTAKVNLLFEVEPEWTIKYLLPLFNWESEAEARSAWKSLLWSPRITMSLMEKLKSNFFDTADHYEKLGKHVENYVALLTYYGLEFPSELNSDQEINDALGKLPQRALDHASFYLFRSVNSSGDQQSEYWNNRVKPFLQNIWPKDREKSSQNISINFAKACIKSGVAFPDASNLVNQWLVPLDYPDQIARSINKEGIDISYPEHSLKLLSKVYPDIPKVCSENLENCLANITNKKPELENDSCFKRLQGITKINV